ncbi:MAG: hypothetical protein J0L82_15275 [Deltaproteobacteria bacterium]|nr:hypothetical protein [Deltaproteobacteria bacterium]
MSRLLKRSIEAIERHGWLLVFPIPRKNLPKSLWSVLHPKSVMKWEWSDDADNRVAELWHLRRELAESKQVIYAKWYRGRATFFSRIFFQHMWVALENRRRQLFGDSRFPSYSSASEILELLEMESPLSTKEIRRATDLQGKENEKRYTSAMKELWSTLSIVGVGEVDDGAFPSLAHAATDVVFEDLCREAEKKIGKKDADQWLSNQEVDRIFLKTLEVKAELSRK